MKKILLLCQIICALLASCNLSAAEAENLATTWPYLNLQERAANKVAQSLKEKTESLETYASLPPIFREQIAKEYYFLNDLKTDDIPETILSDLPSISFQDEIHHGIFPKINYRQVGHILSLKGKKLSDLSILKKIPHIQCVKWLYLDNNNIATLQANTFDHMPNLEMISLKSNRIRTIEDGAFAGVRLLMEIDVDSQLAEQPNLLEQIQKNSPSTKINVHGAE